MAPESVSMPITRVSSWSKWHLQPEQRGLPEANPDLASMASIKLEQAQRGLQRDRESDLERRGIYVRAADSRREQARQLSQLIMTVEQRLPGLVALLGGGKADVVTARRWWRSLRKHEAEAARETAARLPEFVIDQTSALEAAYAA